MQTHGSVLELYCRFMRECLATGALDEPPWDDALAGIISTAMKDTSAAIAEHCTTTPSCLPAHAGDMFFERWTAAALAAGELAPTRMDLLRQAHRVALNEMPLVRI
jgi:hypothetical protein